MTELNPRFSFDTFVVGASNQVAATAARTVAESPGSTYNPLFIYGASGLGKTHVLMAIGQLAGELAPQLQIEYLTVDEFIEAHQAAVAAGQSDALRSRYARTEMLLVDDVQFLSLRREMQEELVRIAEQLQATGAQIVLTSDRPPSEIENLDQRLLSRFDGGLVVDIDAPEYDTRLAILTRHATERGAAFDASVLAAVARLEVQNVRELLGFLNRIVAYQAVSDAVLAADDIQQLLAGEMPIAVASATPAARASGPAAPSADEFADFLSDVSHRVHVQVEAWRSRLEDAIKRWSREGYRTARLEAMLEGGVPAGVEQVVRQFERDVERLQTAQRSMARVDAARAEDTVFLDPDRADDADQLVQTAIREVAPPPSPSDALTFDNYLWTDPDDVTMSAVHSVLEGPATQYNPLVIVGAAGVGKTHLLHAMGHGFAFEPGAVVACLSAQQWLDELAEAIDGAKIEVWRARYRQATALLLDDVQLLAGRERAQEELFHLFNALVERQRQIVFTSSAPPHEVPGLEDRLVSRLEGGLVTRIGRPGRDLRRALIVRKLEEQAVTVEEELADYLAARPADSVRAVLGMLQRVLSGAEERETPLTAGLARELIEGAPPPRPRPSVGARTSGVLVSPVAGLRSREKVVWHWPDSVDRMVEEMT